MTNFTLADPYRAYRRQDYRELVKAYAHEHGVDMLYAGMAKRLDWPDVKIWLQSLTYGDTVRLSMRRQGPYEISWQEMREARKRHG